MVTVVCTQSYNSAVAAAAGCIALTSKHWAASGAGCLAVASSGQAAAVGLRGPICTAAGALRRGRLACVVDSGIVRHGGANGVGGFHLMVLL